MKNIIEKIVISIGYAGFGLMMILMIAAN